MKHILLISFLVCTLSSFSQSKKDTKVIATVTDTTGLFNKVVAALFDHEFDLETNNPQFGIVSTKDKQMKRYATKIKLRLQIKENTITVTSQIRASYHSEFAGDTYVDVSYGGSKNSPMRDAWNEMENIAKQFGTITYSK